MIKPTGVSKTSQGFKNQHPNKLGFVAILAFSVVLLTLGACNANTPRTEYNGIIVDKFVRRAETEIGTLSTLKLLIKDDNGKSFIVTVNKTVFDEAEVGMWIRRDPSGVELTTSNTVQP